MIYFRFPLSSRDIERLLHERSINLYLKSVPARSELFRKIERNVDDHVFLPADHAAVAEFNQN